MITVFWFSGSLALCGLQEPFKNNEENNMIKVVAQFFIRNEEVEKALALGKELVLETQKETGCISYELCQSLKQDSHIAFIEEWENQAALDAHFQTPHFTDLVPRILELTEQETVIAAFKKVV
jgi:quinol monooxygenase YgiN